MAVKFRLFQANPIVGDIEGNAAKLLNACQQAHDDGIDVLVTSECFLSGYPPEDLIFRPIFQQAITHKISDIHKALKELDIGVILGTPRFENHIIFNSAYWLYQDEIQHICDKKRLPDYGVFDDARIFSEGKISNIINFKNIKIGTLICEDMWHPEPAATLAAQNIDILISLNASPFDKEKLEKRLTQASLRAQETQKPILACCMVGGQDELIFDGFSFGHNQTGDLIARAKGFCEDICDITINDQQKVLGCIEPVDICENTNIYQAITLGLRDYIEKNKFKGIVLGLSGGVDSALSAVIAVDALGVDKVHCLLLPSQYTSQESFDDAYDVIKNLGISYDVVSIKDAVNSVDHALGPVFDGLAHDITEENIQSRMRGLILMAYSNKMGHMVLTTGNKSEMAVGYATLYGDMCGGYNALKDLYKTKIYELCHYRNQNKPDIALGQNSALIPENVIIKAPTAELRDNQKDSDSLPDYDILDQILTLMIEKETGIQAIIDAGFEAETVKKIRNLVDRSEYKRRQAAIGAKITAKNFGRDRRYPITQGFRF